MLIVINRVFASEYCVNAMKKQELRKGTGRPGGASGDNEITLSSKQFINYLLLVKINYFY